MTKPSTRNLSAMPSRSELTRICKALAVLDAMMSPEWEYRYYSFNSQWSPGEQMASMRNGSGDTWYAHFCKAGVIIFGLAHESAMYRPGNPWPGLLDDAPVAFADSMMEPAFDTKNLSFCIWLMEGSSDWCMGNVDFPTVSDPDGSGMLLAILDGQPATYQVWAAEYYECAVGLEAIEAIYHQSPLTEELVQTFNPDLTFSDLGEDLLEIGYP